MSTRDLRGRARGSQMCQHQLDKQACIRDSIYRTRSICH